MQIVLGFGISPEEYSAKKGAFPVIESCPTPE